MNLALDPKTTALVLIDLQRAIVGRELAPHSGAEVVRQSVRLLQAFRQRKALTALVRVDIGTFVEVPCDVPMRAPGSPPPPPKASELVSELDVGPHDLVVTKRHWGAFYATELDQMLRCRRIRTIVLGGIATNFGVESTARAAAERGYEQVFVEDAMTSMGAGTHEFAIKNILPRLGYLRSTDEVLAALAP